MVATSEALPSDEVQLVIDTFGLRCSVLGKAAEEDPETVEAELVMGQAISGERVRATGSVHRVEGSGREAVASNGRSESRSARSSGRVSVSSTRRPTG